MDEEESQGRMLCQICKEELEDDEAEQEKHFELHR